MIFSKDNSEIIKDGKVIAKGIRKGNLYVMKISNKPSENICLQLMIILLYGIEY